MVEEPGEVAATGRVARRTFNDITLVLLSPSRRAGGL